MIVSILQNIDIGKKQVAIYVPNEFEIKEWYVNTSPKPEFPYWAKIWPAAIALSDYIEKNAEFFEGKKVVELGAGLGLPSLVAATYAASVLITDYIAEPLNYVLNTIKHHCYTNCSTSICNWNNITNLPAADILLLSDINYKPENFTNVIGVIAYYLEKGTTIFLATPQRIVGRDFINAIQKYVQQNETVLIKTSEDEVAISLYVLSL
jgi:predicted nicotinamide N-methyase